MAKYIEGVHRSQIVLFPEAIDDYISEDNDVRFIDSFVDELDLDKLGFRNASISSSKRGAPSYDPRVLLKTYIYCYMKRIRSSRLIAAELTRNIELMWLTGRLTPDFRTISDFRKLNSKPLKRILSSFNSLCYELHLFSDSLSSLDGSKFKAVNSKDNNFTADKLIDRIKRIDKHIDDYMALLDSNDSSDTQDSTTLSDKLELWKSTKEKYSKLLDSLMDSSDSQVSLSDSESRLMKCNGNMLVGFNAQVTSDTQSHIITNFEISSDAFDNGKIFSSSIKNFEVFHTDVLHVLADGGYVLKNDLIQCLENKIVPILPHDTYVATLEYIDAPIDDNIKQGQTKEDVFTCLHAGIVPDCYSNLDLTLTIQEEVSYEVDYSPIEALNEQLRLEKAKQGFFVRSSLHNSVFCPQGFPLSFKCSKDGDDIFVGGSFCRNCPCKCTSKPFRTLAFAHKRLIQGSTAYKTQTPRFSTHRVVKKSVLLTYIPDKDKYKLRKNTSEHIFGTIKRSHGASYFLTKGIKNVSGEMALSVLAYNFTRIIKLVGVKKLLQHFKNHPICG